MSYIEDQMPNREIEIYSTELGDTQGNAILDKSLTVSNVINFILYQSVAMIGYQIFHLLFKNACITITKATIYTYFNYHVMSWQ